MGLFDKIFGHAPRPPRTKQGPVQFQEMTAYAPSFRSWNGQYYDAELVRAAVDAIARNCAKLSVVTAGSAKKSLQTKLRSGPNEWQTWPQFLYRLATILYVENTAFIVPVYDEYGEHAGYFPILPQMSELVEYGEDVYIRYTFANQKRGAVKLNDVGIMTRHQFKDDIFGDRNGALIPTMELINIQNQGIKEAVKNSNTFRFTAQMSISMDPEDLAEERKRFTRQNLEGDGGGVLLFPHEYTNLQQVKSTPYTVDAEMMKQIKENVCDYFGVNEDIMQGKAIGDKWSAFYELTIEPFSIQFSDVMTRLMFTPRERTQGNYLMATSNRLQYMTAAEKRAVSGTLLDRGIMTRNEVREIWNLPPINGGDDFVIRGEYYNANEKIGTENDEPADDEGVNDSESEEQDNAN